MKVLHMVLTSIPPDSWTREPDSAAGSAHGYDLVILRMPKSLHLCGYVDVPLFHPFASATWEYADNGHEQGLSVHGGVTYHQEHDEFFRIGFDCAHADDLCPGYSGMLGRGIYRDLPYVKSECESLAAQLALEFELDRALGGY